MRILVIGATGQIGYALVPALVRVGHDVTVLVRNARKLPFPDNVTVMERKAFTAGSFAEALDGIEHVIYGVGLPEQFRFDTTAFERVNYTLFETFLSALHTAGLRPLTYISTYEVFEPDASNVIRESHPLADESHMTPYFRAMMRAYRLATAFAAEHNLRLTTIHPAAVYGGIEASSGITTYIDNLVRWKLWKVPVIVPGRFPVVHVDSLADGVIRTLGHPGAYLISDAMTDLHTIATTVRGYVRAYVPPEVPVGLLTPGVRFLEMLARITRRPPIMSRVQIAFITANMEPRTDVIQQTLDWQPVMLNEGIRRYLNV